MKKRYYLFALAFAGLTLTSCGGNGSIGLNYDDSDLDIDTEWVDYSVPITKVSFDSGEESIYIPRGETHAYQYSIEPAKAVKGALSWASSNESVATVSKGVVTALEAGKTTITCSNKEASFEPINLTVEVYVPVTDIYFAQDNLPADFNHQYQLENLVRYSPSDTTETELSWHSSNEDIATINDNGVLTTKDVSGSVIITASSAYINKAIELTVEVADRTIYPDTVRITEFESEVEIGHNFTMKAEAIRANELDVEVTHPEVKYYSDNPSILSVEEDTGIVHALATGSAKIYATAKGKEGTITSEKMTVNVFEVKVQNILLDDINLTNRNGRSDIAIPFEYTTDKAGYPIASIPNFTFKVADETVARVNEAGKLFAVSAIGSTTLTVLETRSGVSKTVNLSVGYEVDTVSISGASEVNVGSSIQLSVSTDPSGVPSEYITYSSSNTDIATVSESGSVSGVSDGVVTITATVLGVSATKEITVSVPEIPFSSDMTYIVGSADYSSGVSKASSTGSWDRANQAKAVNEVVQTPHDTLLYERRAIVKFNQGDLWKLRNASAYLEIDGYTTGTYRIGEYKVNEGAFVGTSPDMSVTADNNILVNRTGYYAIYHAQYTNEHPEGWYSIYVGRHELNLSDTTPQIQINKSTVLEAHDWQGDLSYEITEGSSLISVARGTVSENYKFTVTAKDTAGTAKIVFTDSWKSVEVIITISTDAPLPKTFEDGIPYLVGNADYHTGTATGTADYWGSDASKALKFAVSTAPKSDDVIVQYEATVTFVKDNQFKVVIGGETLYWEVAYEDTVGAFAKGQMSHPDNVVVNTEGTYKIYVKCLDQNRGWSVYVEANSTPSPTPTPEALYYVEGINGAWEIDEQYAMNQDSLDDNHYSLGPIELSANTELKVYSVADDEFIGSNEGYTKDATHWTTTSEGNLKVLVTGNYYVDLYVEHGEGNHIKLYYVDGGGDTPVEDDITYTVTSLPTWIQNDGCVIFAWVWSSNDTGSWKSLTISGTTATFTVNEELTGFLLARCISGTTKPDWSVKGNVVGRIYNQTENITCKSGTYSYSCSSWKEYNPQ